MQRIKFKNSRKLNLAATLYDADSDAVVIMAHGFGCESGKFDYIAQCLNASGYNVFILDFSGCGESDDDRITCDKQIDDLKSAIAFVQGLGYKQLALWGNSLGSRICLQAYSSEIITMINGDGDSEELMLKEIAAKAMHLLPGNSRHEIIPGAAHRFLGYLDQIVNLGLSWLEEYMPVLLSTGHRKI